MATSNSDSTDVAIVNPWCSHAATQLRAKQLQAIHRESSQATNQAVAVTMGV
jgi:hypothetical protein